jgi:hypothetical protein
MGNVCGKEEPDPFATPGRPLGTTPAKASTAPVPSKAQRKVGGPARTLGGSGSQGESAGSDEARRRAAAAAEVRTSFTITSPSPLLYHS